MTGERKSTLNNVICVLYEMVPWSLLLRFLPFLHYSVSPPILVNYPRSYSLAKLHNSWLDRYKNTSKNNGEKIIMESMSRWDDLIDIVLSLMTSTEKILK